LPGYLAAGAGVGYLFPSQASAAAVSVPSDRFATGMAMNITARQLGAALGVAVLVSVVAGNVLGGLRGPGVADLRGGFVMCAIGILAVMVVTLPWRPIWAAEASGREPSSAAEINVPMG
jgi:hypothetical protein